MTSVGIDRRRSPPRLSAPKIAFFIAAQAALSLGVDKSRALATLYPVVLLVIGFVALVRRDIKRVAYVAAYTACVEVIFRITKAAIFYEFGKYVLVFLLGATLLQMLPRCRGVTLPAIIVAGVVPSAALTFVDAGLSSGRQLVATVTVGVVALALSLIVFSNLRTTPAVFERLLWIMVVGVSGTATLSTVGTITTDNLTFGTASNYQTSAGYGPVQVSALLSLGALLCLMLAARGTGMRGRALPIGLLIWFATQSVLTFSRGGLAVLVLSSAMFILHRMWSPERRGGLFAVLAVVAVSGLFIAPALDRFTGGAIEERFGEVQTGRTTLARQDLHLWLEHPLTGVGPGMSRTDRGELTGTSSHTEYTRLLAEHGLFGLISLLGLLAVAIRIYIRSPRSDRAHAAALLTWCLAHMAYANLRIAAASLVFGLAALHIEPQDTGGPAMAEDAALERIRRVRPVRAAL